MSSKNMEKQLVPPSQKPKLTKFKNNFLKSWQLYAFLFPAIAYFILLHYVPMYGAQIAFKDYFGPDGIWGSEWIGFDHFIRFFDSYYFWRLLVNTFVLNLYMLILFPLPIILALSINELKDGLFKKWTQTLTYAPHFVSVVVVVGIIIAFTDPESGMINNIITKFGGDPVQFMQEASWFRHLFIWSDIWQGLGWSSIIYMAALAGVNPELHEAARVDGASRIQRILHINIPAILPTIIVLLILNFGNFMSIGFEKVLLMQNELNASTSDIIQTFVYESGLIRGEMDYSAAIGLFDSIINITLIVTMNWAARKYTDNSLW